MAVGRPPSASEYSEADDTKKRAASAICKVKSTFEIREVFIEKDME